MKTRRKLKLSTEGGVLLLYEVHQRNNKNPEANTNKKQAHKEIENKINVYFILVICMKRRRVLGRVYLLHTQTICAPKTVLKD